MNELMNTPVEVLRIAVRDGEISREKRLEARALPMRPGMEWLAEAETLEARLQEAEGKARLDVLRAVAEFVAAYDESWPAEAILEQVTGPQIVGALLRLKELNDPFAVVRAKKQADEERGLRMLEALGKTNPAGLEALIAKHSQAASADSAKTSG